MTAYCVVNAHLRIYTDGSQYVKHALKHFIEVTIVTQ